LSGRSAAQRQHITVALSLGMIGLPILAPLFDIVGRNCIYLNPKKILSIAILHDDTAGYFGSTFFGEHDQQ
jgi:hypothetical protein